MSEISVGIPVEGDSETRVAMVPLTLPSLTGAGLRVVLAKGAGTGAGYTDRNYQEKGAVLGTEDEAWGCDVVLRIRALGAGTGKLGAGQTLIGLCGALFAPPALNGVAGQGTTVFALELIPRSTRAQSMDVLSSQATVAGYRAVLLGATALPKLFPMLTTAAGTIAPARVLVIGAGVAGLQAIATARRLGAVVDAYDVRPAVKEQVQSLGARFVELPIETAGGETAGGYAQAVDQAFYQRQQQLMAQVVGASDVVITTAAVPGQPAPKLVSRAMVEGMKLGSVVVDVVADQGGNCELTRPGETVVHQGVTIIGHDNLPGTAPFHASQLYARNISSFLVHLVKDGRLNIDLDDEITRETLVARGGDIVNPRVREAFGLEPTVAEAAS